MSARFLGILLALTLAAQEARAEPGSLFKNLFSGSAKESESSELSGPRAYDPSDPYCPPVSIAEGGAAIQAYAGGVGDGTRLRHQLTFGRLSRECALRDDSSITVKVGVELRALLGPAGVPGRFEAPINVSTQLYGVVLASRSRRLTVTVPSGATSGSATMVEADLAVPADKAGNYTIMVSLGAPAPSPAQAARRPHKQAPKPAATAATTAE